jgi:hypothetical protein
MDKTQRPTAVLSLILSTPAYPEADAEGVARNLEDNAELAAARAAAIRELAAMGWRMQQPFLMGDRNPRPGDCGDFQDVVIYFRKEFESEAHAETEARECGASIDENWSLGWNDDGTVNDFGLPNVEWWTEA